MRLAQTSVSAGRPAIYTAAGPVSWIMFLWPDEISRDHGRGPRAAVVERGGGGKVPHTYGLQGIKILSRILSTCLCLSRPRSRGRCWECRYEKTCESRVLVRSTDCQTVCVFITPRTLCLLRMLDHLLGPGYIPYTGFACQVERESDLSFRAKVQRYR